MATPKKSVTKRSSAKTKFSEPILEDLIFTKCSTKRTVDEDGLPAEFDPTGAAMRLIVTTNCQALTSREDGRVRAALGLSLEAKATSGEESFCFYEGEVQALGYFLCDPSMTETDVSGEFSKKSSYFNGAFNIVHAVASRELERLIELTGIPSPGIPMSQARSDTKTTQTAEL